MAEVVRGSFTIDRSRAREKLIRYQLANPYAYVLELVQSAVLRGAERVDFRIDADDMVMRFQGEPFSAEELSNLELTVLEKAQTRRARSRRQLAAGLLAAEALKPKSVTVDSYGGARLVLKKGEPQFLGESSATKPGTTIHLRDSWHPRLLLEFWRNLRGRGREQTLLKKHCASAALEVVVNGKVVSGHSHGLAKGARVGEIEIDTQGFQGWAGMVSGLPSALEVYCDGVLIETISLTMGALPFRAVVRGEQLEKDLSGSKVLRNQVFDQLWGVVWAARKESVKKFCSEGLELFAEQARKELLGTKEPKKLREFTAYPGCLCKLRVWRLADGSVATFEELFATRDSLGFLPYSLEAHPNEPLEEMPVVWLSDKESLPVMKSLIRLRNVTRRLRNQGVRKANQKRWRSRPMEPELQGGRYLAQSPVKSEGVRGEVGIQVQAPPPFLRLIKEGCLLHEFSPRGWPRGLEVVLEANFEPTPNYDGVSPNVIFARALLCAAMPLTQMYEKLARPRLLEFLRSKPKGLEEALGDFLSLVSHDDPVGRFVAGCNLSLDRFPELREQYPWEPPDLDGDSPLLDLRWVKTVGNRKLSLRELEQASLHQDTLSLGKPEEGTLKRLLGDRFVLSAPSAGPAPASQKVSALAFVADSKWLDEEYFLTALRAELRHLKRGETNLAGDIELSRVMLTDSDMKGAVGLRTTGAVVLSRSHPLLQAAMEHYKQDPTVLLLLCSVLISSLNRDTPMITDEDEARLQDELLEYALRRNTQGQMMVAKDGEPGGFLEPMCASGFGTGWALDPAGLGLRLYLEEPSLAAEPLAILHLDSVRKEGGHHFLFELPDDQLDGRRVKLWACLLDPKEGTLVQLTGSPRTFAAPLETPASPVGWLESVSEAGVVKGWCLDPNTPEAHVQVHAYLDGDCTEGECAGWYVANLPRADVNEFTGYPGDHGFSFSIPEKYQDGCAHKVWLYSHDHERVSDNPLMDGAPLAYGCHSAAPKLPTPVEPVAVRAMENRCQGKTKQNKRCTRRVKTGARFCYQHASS